METIKVKPWGLGQGDFVIINTEDFDPNFHEKLEEDKPQQKQKQKQKQTDK